MIVIAGDDSMVLVVVLGLILGWLVGEIKSWEEEVVIYCFSVGKSEASEY